MTDKFVDACENPGGLETSCGSPSNAYFSCANVRITGELESIPPLYQDYLSAPIDDRLPYASEGSSSVWRKIPSGDNSWTLKTSNATTSATLATTKATSSPATPSTSPSQALKLWQEWMIPIVIVGAGIAIFLTTCIFITWRKRRKNRLQASNLPKINVNNFDAFNDDVFDDDF